MKRIYLSLLTLILVAIQVIAAPVDPEKALEIANDFWANKVSLKKNIQSRLLPAEGALKAPSRATSKEDEAYYVFTEANNNGFVIVSGDDRLNPIVGYSTNAVSGEMPPALSVWLEEYSEYVNEVRAGKAKPTLHKAKQVSSSIEPMLVTAWDQDGPYNNMCPILGNGQRAYTGCGNTAAAQVMRFHKWPSSPIADVEWDNNITGETEFCEMKSHVYDWDNMLCNYLISKYSETEANAVALLMADLGKATKSVYEPGITGNISPNIIYALVHVFNYSPELFIADRMSYTYEEYIALIRENLNKRQPIIYCGFGQNYDGGHGFVCDGIDENNLLHIDWGWSGIYNGYFDMAIMEPRGNGIGGLSDRYNVGQHAIVNIKPRAEGEVNKGGTISLEEMSAYDIKTEENVDEQTCGFVNGMAEVDISIRLANFSHSDVEGSFGIGTIDMDGNLVNGIEFDEPTLYTRSNEQTYSGTFTFSVSNVNSSEYFLPVGKYIVGAFFMNKEEEIEYMRGACNGLILEVTEDAITLSSPKPSYKLDEFRIIKMPERSNEELVFNATFANESKINRTVILVPVINHYENGVKVKSEQKRDAAVTTELLDANNIIVTFTIPNALAQNGTYSVSFEYLFNEEDDDAIDTSKLISITGESKPFDVEIIPADNNEYDYSFSAEFIGQETSEEGEIAVINATMGKDISECKFLVVADTNEETLEAVAEYIASTESEEFYTLNESAELRLPLTAGEFGIVFVLYDVNGEPLDEYYTCIFNLTTGIEDIEAGESGISIDWNCNVISVAGKGTIELLDASGKLVKKANGSNISIAELEKGIYIVKHNGNAVKVVKR